MSLEKFLKFVIAEEGYLEKKSSKSLDSKTANAGSGNYTKYARDLDKIPDFYNGKKQGFHWCDVFVDWCFVKYFGVEEAKRLLNQPNKSLGAGCGYSANYFKQIGRFFKKDPKPGDQIFFLDSDGDVGHTGIVIKVDSSKVYTVEGNTSSVAGVIANGGCVRQKSYNLTYSRIYGYGRPDYKFFDEVTVYQVSVSNINDQSFVDKIVKEATSLGYKVEQSSKVVQIEVEPAVPDISIKYAPSVLEWQEAAIADGFEFPQYGADGKWGKECESVAQKAVVKYRGTQYLYKNLTKIVQAVVGIEVDGYCGPATKAAIEGYQAANGLEKDGMWGPACWKHLFGN